MSMAVADVSRTPFVALDTHHVHLAEPDCVVCGRDAVGAVTSDDGEAESFCPNHAVEVMAAAILAGPTAPPLVSIYDVAIYSPWGSAA